MSRGSSLGESIDETPADLDIETFIQSPLKKLKSEMHRSSTVAHKSKTS